MIEIMKGLFGQHVESVESEKRIRSSEKKKICDKKYRRTSEYKTKQKRRRHSPKGKLATKRYRGTEKYKSMRRRWINKFHFYNPNSRKSINAVRQAIGRGELLTVPLRACYYCYEQAEIYHHYIDHEPEHWLDVIPVCTECHGRIDELRAPEIVSISAYRNFRLIG